MHYTRSHGNYIVDHGKSWGNHRIVFLNFCGNPDTRRAAHIIFVLIILLSNEGSDESARLCRLI